jgi:hypothetical protein
MDQAIVAYSTPRGRVRERLLNLATGAPDSGAGSGGPGLAPSLGIDLEPTTALDTRVPIGEIARVQWEIFPELRALEDRVGDPLYYPFAMSGATESFLLPGHVFKLPALFVEHFSALASVRNQFGWSAVDRSPAGDPPGSAIERAAVQTDTRGQTATARGGS